MNIGMAIKTCRIQRGMTQAQLAQRSDISVPHLSLVELGKRDLTWSRLQRLADSLDVPVSILVFLACAPDELEGISPEVATLLAQATLRLLQTA